MVMLHALILAIVEGITEFLPISSTAHLSLVSQLLSIPQTDFLKSFEVIIQSGAMVGIIPVLWPIIRKGIPFKQIIIGLIPAVIIGFALFKFIKGFLFGNTLVIAGALILGGIIIILVENKYKGRNVTEREVSTFSNKESFLMGLAQALAVIPGVSRSGAIIISGVAMKLSRQSIVAYSFLLGLPTIFLASAFDIYKTGIQFSRDEWKYILIGFCVSGIVTYLVGRWFYKYINRMSFKSFGWYRILLGLVVLAVYFH